MSRSTSASVKYSRLRRSPFRRRLGVTVRFFGGWRDQLSTVGVGSPGQLLGILMQKETGTRFTLVPYRGAGPLVQDVVAGQIDMTFINTATALPFVRDGSIKALGLTSLKRIAAAPDIPTMDEAGLRGFSFSLWAALFAPTIPRRTSSTSSILRL
jgi:tripartite-type tricarboxylate transporter receptor subunit TctC